jgi:hypothetical protein
MLINLNFSGNNMDEQIKLLTETGINLTTLAVKGTVSAVNTKIKALKTEKDLELVRNKYDELINEILSEREEAIRIAQLYKSEIERIEISDDDINHLNRTIDRILSILAGMSPTTNLEGFSQIKDLINVDTLKALQLLGFNFKAEIGEPLTELCANAINSLSKQKSNNSNISKNQSKH